MSEAFGDDLAFPRARYLVQRADWDAFQDPAMKAHAPVPYIDEQVTPLRDLGVLDLLDGDHRLTGELAALPTPGHTPGHMSLLVESGGERAVLTGDVAVHPAQVTEPGWCFVLELDPAAATDQRQRFFGRALDEDLLLVACHFPAPGTGKVTPTPTAAVGGRRWRRLTAGAPATCEHDLALAFTFRHSCATADGEHMAMTAPTDVRLQSGIAVNELDVAPGVTVRPTDAAVGIVVQLVNNYVILHAGGRGGVAPVRAVGS